jgi:hypothetical protein
MQTIATTEEKLKIVHSCLCSGLPFFVDYGFTLDYNGHEYKKAKKSLEAQQAAGTWKSPFDLDDICIEDVQTEMLRMGFTLKFKGGEGNKSSHITPLNLEVIEKNWDKINQRHLADMVNENDDANTADIIMQGILFGEEVYG